MSYSTLKEDLDALNTNYRKNSNRLKLNFPWLENDIKIFNAIYTKNTETLKKCLNESHHARQIIKCLKNEPEYLDFFLSINMILARDHIFLQK